MADNQLFARLPGYIRARDAAEGYPLRALLAVAEAEFDVLYADIAQLYDDWFIDTCEEWVVPYIGDLLGAKRLNQAGGAASSLRAYVANTLSYRRAKGTAAVIEQLARDVTADPARVVEFWSLLVQSQHVNHVRAANRQCVDIRDADRARQVDSPFDPWAHNLESRPIATREGRYAIPNIGVFLWRLLAGPIGFAFDDPADVQGGVTPRPVAAADGRFFLHPAGVDAPLFNRPRGEPVIAHLATEAELPAPLRRFPLHAELAARRAGVADPNGYFGLQPVLQVRLDGATLAPERLFVANLGEQSGGGWRRPAAPGDVMIDPELGRLSLHPADEARPVEVAYALGTPAPVGAGPWDRRAAFANWFAAFTADGGTPPGYLASVTRRVAEHTANPDNGGPCVASLADAITLWNDHGNGAGVRGVIAILDNASYAEALPAIEMAADAGLAIIAAVWPVTLDEAAARHRLIGSLAPAARRPFIDAALAVTPGGGASTLVLDGLMLSGGVGVAAGGLGTLALHTCTVGATDAGLAAGITVPAGAAVALVELDASILGPITLGAGVGILRVTDSIVNDDRVADDGAGVLSAVMAIDAADTDIAVVRSTVFGRIVARTGDIDGALVAGRVRIARRQQGCARYSLIPLGSRTAQRYRCQPDLALAAATAALRAQTGDPSAQLSDSDAARVARTVLPRFTASRFEHPAFAQLHALCPPGIAAGGEGGTEMGVYARQGGPIRLANLRVAIGDTLRVGLETGLFTVT